MNEEQLNNHIQKTREAILNDLRRRWKEGSIPDHGVKPASGIMDCPICKIGKLKYSRSGYNGHVHAKCSTENCVAWMVVME